MIAVSLTGGLSDTRPETRDFTSQGDLATFLRGLPPAPAKNSAPMLKLARTDGRGSAEKNLLAITGVEGDYDFGEMTPSRAIELLEAANINAIVVTSASNDLTGKGHRWRVLAVTSEELPVSQREALVARLNGALGGVLARESFTNAQRYFIGPVQGNEANYEVRVTFGGVPDRGRFIDEAVDLDANAIGKSGKTQPATDRPASQKPSTPKSARPAPRLSHAEADAIVAREGRRLATGDGRRDLLKSYIGSRSAKGLNPAEIAALVRAYVDQYFDPNDPTDENDIRGIVVWATDRDARAAHERESTINVAIVGHAAGDAGALFSDAAVEALRDLQLSDAAEFQRVRSRIMKLTPRPKMGDLDKAIAGPRGDQRDDSTATQLVAIAKRNCELVRDAQGGGYAVLSREGHRECWKLGSMAFSDWLSHQHYQDRGIAPGDQAIATAVATLRGIATFEGERHDVYLRIAKHGDAYYLDLCDDAWRVIEIDRNGWRVLEKSPVLFKRTATMQALPEPATNGRLDRLWYVTNIEPRDRDFVLVWLLESMRPDTPDAVLELCGEQGSAKSDTQRALRALIDPNDSPIRAVPKTVEDFFACAGGSGLVSLDNLSNLSPALQDAMCTLATGTGHAGRKLYTDADEHAVTLKRPIILNSITPVATRPDLIDRTLHIAMPVIKARRLAAEVAAELAEALPEFLGGLLDLFAATLAVLPSVKIAPGDLPRNADLAVLGEAMFRAQGRPHGEFLKKLHERRRDGAARAIESSPVAAAILDYMDEHPEGFVDDGTGRNTVKAFLDALRPYQESTEGWPRTPRGLSDALRRCAPALRQQGIDVRMGERTRKGYRVSVRRLPEPELAPAPPERPELCAPDLEVRHADARVQAEDIDVESLF